MEGAVGGEAYAGDVTFGVDENHGGEVVRGMHDGCSLDEMAERANEFKKVVEFHRLVVLF